MTYTIFDPLMDADAADRMLGICERFGTYTQYSAETSETRFAPRFIQRYDTARHYVTTGGLQRRDEPVELLGARSHYFREEYAYGDDIFADGIEGFMHHEGFVNAARDLFGRDLIVPAIVYANLLVPGQELAVHTDVPEFRGANRRVLPQWLMVVMHHSGLFEKWRMPIATGVAWFGNAPGGEFVFYPDGARAAPKAIDTQHNTAVLTDTDSVFHGVGHVGDYDADPPPTFGARLEFGDNGTWKLCEGESDIAELAWPDVRLSVSWKAYCFADTAEHDLCVQHRDDLSLEQILDMLLADLRERDIVAARPSDEHELAEILIDTYIEFPTQYPERASSARPQGR